MVPGGKGSDADVASRAVAAAAAASSNNLQSCETLSSAANNELWKGLPTIPPLLNLDPEQQAAAVHMTHYLNNLMCMVSEHFTSLERYGSMTASQY